MALAVDVLILLIAVSRRLVNAARFSNNLFLKLRKQHGVPGANALIVDSVVAHTRTVLCFGVVACCRRHEVGICWIYTGVLVSKDVVYWALQMNCILI